MTLILSGSDGVSDIDGSASTPAIRGSDANTGIFFPAADTIAFAEGGAEAMRINSSGNVGIGTTSPVDTGGYGRVLDIQSTSGAQIVCRDSDDTTKFARFSFDGGATNAVSLDAIGTGTYTVFRTAGTERARITSAGDFVVGVNATVNGAKNYTQQSANSVALGAESSGAGFTSVVLQTGVYGTAAGTGFNHIESRNASNVVIFQVRGNGDVQNTNNSYGSISDIKTKQDIVDASSQWEDIKNVRVRKFRFKNDQTGPLHIGVVAQELEEVSPGLLSESPDYEEVEVTDEEGNVTTERQATGTVTKSVKYSVLYMKAVKALQEAMERIETLEAKVAALEAR